MFPNDLSAFHQGMAHHSNVRQEVLCAMAIPNRIGLVAYRTLRDVANNIPGGWSGGRSGGLDGDGHRAHEGPLTGAPLLVV